MNNLQFNNYAEMLDFNRQEVEAFPLFYAFTDEALNEGMQRLGVDNFNDICKVGWATFIQKTDFNAYVEMIEQQQARKEEAFKDDSFLKNALIYELFNHEYSYTLEPESAIEALGFQMQEIENNKRFMKILKQAEKYVLDKSC